jgi:hypothetical protein
MTVRQVAVIWHVQITSLHDSVLCQTVAWIQFVRFQVLMATSMKTAVFWVVAPCSLVDIDQSFRGAYCLHHEGDHQGHDDGGSKHL